MDSRKRKGGKEGLGVDGRRFSILKCRTKAEGRIGGCKMNRCKQNMDIDETLFSKLSKTSKYTSEMFGVDRGFFDEWMCKVTGEQHHSLCSRKIPISTVRTSPHTNLFPHFENKSNKAKRSLSSCFSLRWVDTHERGQAQLLHQCRMHTPTASTPSLQLHPQAPLL